MGVGNRIKFFRTKRGMTQKCLGIELGFPKSSADIRITQYENETRTPKDELTSQIADILNVSPNAIKVPDIESDLGMMHTFFQLEDIYNFQIDKVDGKFVLALDNGNIDLHDMLATWQEQSQKFKNGEITKDEYDNWRYNYPKFDNSNNFVKTPSDSVNSAMLDAFKDKLD